VVVQRFVQQKLYLFLQHCFGHWPLDASFRAVSLDHLFRTSRQGFAAWSLLSLQLVFVQR